MTQYMEFEKPLAELEGKAEELRAMARESEDQDMDISEEAAALDAKAAVMLKNLYKSLHHGANAKWRATQSAHIAKTTSKQCSQISRHLQVIETLRTTTQLLAALPVSTINP